MSPHKVAIVLGTRPEAIKLAPVILAMRDESAGLRPIVCSTGQHREMLAPVLEWFDIHPDYDLGLMQASQGLADLSARLLTGINSLLMQLKPDAVLTQGDTTSAAMAALTAFYQRIPVAHVEAGLRTGNINSPFPEEMNRRLNGMVATLHFAPTKLAADALIAEGIDSDSIFVVGNTVVDALLLTVDRHQQVMPAQKLEGILKNSSHRLVLVTAHRRESFGPPFESLCRAIRTLVERNGEIEVVYPVHLNPRVRDPVDKLLRNVERIHLIEPVNYQQFIQLMLRSYLILTDSGGIQEEATVLGKPTLVLRDNTERREAVEAGTSMLVGTDESRIVSAAENLLCNDSEYSRMANAQSPFGDGFAAQKIVRTLSERLGSPQDVPRH